MSQTLYRGRLARKMLLALKIEAKNLQKVAAERDNLANKVVEWEKKFAEMQKQQEQMAQQLAAQARTEAEQHLLQQKQKAEQELEVERQRAEQLRQKQQQEAEQRMQAEMEARLKAEIEQRVKAELEAQMRADYEAKLKAEYEARLQAEVSKAKHLAELEAESRAAQTVRIRSRSNSIASDTGAEPAANGNSPARVKAPSVDVAELELLRKELARTKTELNQTKEAVEDERRRSIIFMQPPPMSPVVEEVRASPAAGSNSEIEEFRAKIAALEEQNRLLQLEKEKAAAKAKADQEANAAANGRVKSPTMVQFADSPAGPAAGAVSTTPAKSPGNLLRIPSAVGMVQQTPPRSNILGPGRLARSGSSNANGSTTTGNQKPIEPLTAHAGAADVDDGEDEDEALPRTREKRSDSTVEFGFNEVYEEPTDEANVLDASSEDEDSDDDVIRRDNEDEDGQDHLGEDEDMVEESYNYQDPLRSHPHNSPVVPVSLDSIDRVYGDSHFEYTDTIKSPASQFPIATVDTAPSDSDDETTIYRPRTRSRSGDNIGNSGIHAGNDNDDDDDCSTSVDSDDEEEDESGYDPSSRRGPYAADDDDDEEEIGEIISISKPFSEEGLDQLLSSSRNEDAHQNSNGTEQGQQQQIRTPSNRLNAAADIALESAKLMQKRPSSLSRIFASSNTNMMNGMEDEDEEATYNDSALRANTEENAKAQLPLMGEDSFDNLLASAEKLIGKSPAVSPVANSNDTSSPALRRISSISNSTNMANEVRSLLEAILRKDYETVESMLVATPKLVRMGTESGKVPLHLACLQDDIPMMELLLHYNADIEAQDEQGRACIHLCRSMGALSICLKESAILNKADAQGMQPIHIYSKEGMPYLVKALLEAGADPMATEPSKRRTCLHIAAENGDFDVLSTVLFYSKVKLNIDSLDAEGNAVSHLIAANTNPNGQQQRSLMLLLDKGSSISCTTSKRASLLHLVCCNQSLSQRQIAEPLAQMLIEMNANVNTVDIENCSPLILAAAMNEWGLCRVLLEGGADMNIPCTISSVLLRQAMGRAHSDRDMGTNLSLLSQTDVLASDLIPRTYRLSLYACLVSPQTKVPFESRDRCMQCSVSIDDDKSRSTSSFSPFGNMFKTNIKNHCRHCNRVVCKDCIVKELPRARMPQFVQDSSKETTMKVCTVCYEIIAT
jgi:ankyrin repeat protein